MATRTTLIVDVDGPPSNGGTCQVNLDFDDVSLQATQVRWTNTMRDPAVFALTRDSDRRVRTFTIGAAGSSSASGAVAPPYNLGGGAPWTPMMQINSEAGGQPFVGAGWSVAFAPQR